MIDYRTWHMIRAPNHIQEIEPAILAPRQRVIFWLIAAGVKPREIALVAGCCLNTVKSYRDQIRNRIPGLSSNAAFGVLAAEIVASVPLPSPCESPHPDRPMPHRLARAASATLQK